MAVKFTFLRFIKRRSKTILIILSAIFVATFYLLEEFEEGSGQSYGIAIAAIVSTTGSVRSKSAGAFVWRNLEKGDALYPNDTLSTADDGFAIIKMADGAVVELEPNTFVVIDQSNKKNLSLLVGAFDLLERDGKGDRRVSRDEESSEDVRELLVKLIKPPLFSVFYTATSIPKKMSFVWSDIRSGPKGAMVQISRSRDFPERELIEVAKKNNFPESELKLNPGIYFWRVVDQNAVPLSETSEFTIEVAQALRPSAPISKTLSWNKSVKFRWNAPQSGLSSTASMPISHTLELARDSAFRKLSASRAIKAGQLSATLENQEEGAYSWRIKTQIGDTTVYSRVETFQLEHATRLTIESLSPAEATLVRATDPVILTWKSNADEVEYQVHIRSDGKLLTNLSTTQTSIALESLSAGNYQWSVTASKEKFRTTTKPRHFTVLESASFLLTAPRNGRRMLQSEARPFLFVWNNVPRATRYRVELASDRSFERRLAFRDYNSTRAPSGDLILTSTDQYYFWRVISFNGDHPLRMSAVGDFRYGIRSDSSAPILLFPATKRL